MLGCGSGCVVASREPGYLSCLVLIERGGAVCIVGESGASLSGSDLIAADRQSGDPDSVARRWSSTRRGDTASRSNPRQNINHVVLVLDPNWLEA